MSYSNPDSLNHYGELLDRKIKQLLNSDLKQILKEENLPVSGVKVNLQERILEHVRNAIQSEDYVRFEDLFNLINRYGTQIRAPPFRLPGHTTHNPHQSTSPSTNHAHSMPNGYQSYGSGYANGVHQSSQNSFTFKKSPFYEIKESFCQPVWLPSSSAPLVYLARANQAVSSRSTATATVALNHDQAARLSSDSSLRIMVYCAADADSPPKDVSFPAQLELKCNGEGYGGNLKGIKKKSGTTKPADITPLIRKSAAFKNQVMLNYAATDKRFLFCVYLVRKTSVEQLVDKIKTGQFISKQTVVNEMISKAKDPDIVATSTVMTLKCPLSGMRMQVPCRSTLCNHNQCFDANSFLQLQEQAPQWSCPTCNKTFKFESIVVDQFVEDILRSTPSSAEQITIEPNGEWQEGVHKSNDFRVPSARTPTSGGMKRKHEVLELDGPSPSLNNRASIIRDEEIRTSSTSQGCPTPSFTSREASTAASTTSRSTSKRPQDDVIDLTLDSDDDEDDPPRRRIKRQSTGGFITSTPQTSTPPVTSSSAPSRPAPDDQNPRPLYSGIPTQFRPQSHQSISFPMQPQQQQPRWSPSYTQPYSPGYNDGYGQQQGSAWRSYR